MICNYEAFSNRKKYDVFYIKIILNHVQLSVFRGHSIDAHASIPKQTSRCRKQILFEHSLEKKIGKLLFLSIGFRECA